MEGGGGEGKKADGRRCRWGGQENTFKVPYYGRLPWGERRGRGEWCSGGGDG